MGTVLLTLEAGLLICRFCRVESEELGKLAAVLSVLVDTQLDVLAERLVELVKVVLVLRDLGEQVKALLDEVLPDDLENFVLLQRLTRDIERQILGVDDASDEVKILGNDVFAIIHDKDASHIKLDIVTLLLGLEEIKWRALTRR